MIHIHGSPFSGSKKEIENLKLCMHLYSGKDCGGLVSYANSWQLDLVARYSNFLWLDNGAFSRYNKLINGGSDPRDFDWDSHWTKYYLWVMEHYSRITWFIIPDVIMGTEEENDRLIERVPIALKDKAVPVWHTTESIDRFVRLCEEYDIVCIGACGEHHYIIGDACQQRLTEAFTEIYFNRDIKVKIHGLRMTDNRVVARFPFYSCDSTKVVTCERYSEKYHPEIKGRAARTVIFKRAMESTKSPTVEEWVRLVNSGVMLPKPVRIMTKKPQNPMRHNQLEIFL